MVYTIRNARSLIVAGFTLLIVAAGLFAATGAHAQSGLTIVVDHVDATGWRAHIEGSCPEGYGLKTRNLEGRWEDDQSGATIRAYCLRASDGFECWHVTKWVRNPGFVAPTSTRAPEGAPTATAWPTPTPCPECPVPTATAAPAPELPAPTPGAPSPTPGLPALAPDTGTQPGAPSGPCPNNPNGMPARWVHRDGRDVPICDETSRQPAPAPAASVAGYAVARDGGVVAHFDVTVTQGEVARAEYVFSDGTSQLVLDEPFSPDEVRAPLPNPLEVAIPAGQTVTLVVTVVGYDDLVTVSSGAVAGGSASPPAAGVVAGGSDAALAPAAAETRSLSESRAVPRAAASGANTRAVPLPRALPRTGGEIGEREAFWMMYGNLAMASAVFLIALGVGLRLALARRALH